MDNSKELLRMENITKIYSNGFIANKDISFDVKKGEIHALIGENGAGKTTLMKILFGLEDHQEGKIYIEGEEVHIANPLDAIGKGIGMVHQHFMQVPNLTIAENVILGMETGQGLIFDKKKAIEETKKAAQKYQLDVDPEAKIEDISVGLKQKVELLKALIRGAKVLILDEPTAVLTPQETRELFVQLKQLKDMGYGIVFISHKLEEVMELCDRCTVLRHGRVVGSGIIGELNETKMSKMIVGRDVTLSIDKAPADTGELILRIRGLNYINSINKWKIRNLDFGIRSGEVLGIAGVEGNGQSELSDIIAGLRRATSGSIEVVGKEITNKSVKEIRSSGVAYISEDRMTYGCAPSLSIKDNIGSIYKDQKKFSKGPMINDKELNKFVDDCIRDFEIACSSRNDPVRLLSGGNIQKVIVAREFSSGAKLLVANQPTRGIDVGTTSLIRRMIVKYAREKGMAVLLISSDLNEVLEVSDRLVVMFNGQFTAHFHDPKSVTDEVLGEYMLGVKRMTLGEMGDLL